MAFPDLLPDRQYTAPAAADGVGIMANGLVWVNTSWVTVLASAPSNGILTGVVVRPTAEAYFGAPYGSFEIDIGVGATPTVIATIKGTLAGTYFSKGNSDTSNTFACPIGIAAIVSGQPISARLRQETPDTSTWHVAVTYVRTPLAGVLETTAGPQYALPASTVLDLLTPSPAWTFSSWHTMVVGGDRVIVGAHVYTYGITSGDLDIGDGSASRATIPITTGFGFGFPFWMAIPPVRVTGDLRVRVRGANPGMTYVIALHAVDWPLT